MDAAVGRAGADRDDGQRLGRQPVDPVAGGDRLAGLLVGAERGPVALFLDLLVGDRAFDDQDERVEPALLGLVPELHELVAVLVGEHGVVQVDLGQPGNRPQDDVFDAGLRGGGDRDRVAVAAQPGRDPEDVHLLDGRRPLRLASVRDVVVSAIVGAPFGRSSVDDVDVGRIG